jgi:hypothetical protein
MDISDGLGWDSWMSHVKELKYKFAIVSAHFVVAVVLLDSTLVEVDEASD